ncbi:cobalt-precorrin-5B (C(1))-methyltransferase [Lichenihabitans sp. PAMC28606]|uniref:cobalt-precorrin-5B (C(1))-methyltransferase n=1 Tax=Lichenihabitans sp. PAMC28606 TaxID=2880932 RepID=UPI001D0B6BC8|nr:cobalt-precorrin-5B (C(1))-methyltransferase [Lichenihabitans sp. PAMC28606]UDL94988.1 cobalt-precorrin-5B (C(1))-methyltransferase [Lichenihabitans sp. PAMC28606]
MTERTSAALRRGWTTGTCATAAARAAYEALVTGAFPDPVSVALPNGQRIAFALASTEHGANYAQAGIVKDAGDDPDVTHGAVILATVRLASEGRGILFRAGAGVGTVTRPGLALGIGEPAINPVPRAMIRAAIDEAATAFDGPRDVDVEISIPGGEKLAERTLNGRLGIVGGLSILGTTGIVIPYSCAAWIDSIHRGIDVARALGLPHVAGATGDTSEKAIQAHYALSDPALIDMGDFVGGMLKYLRRYPVPRVTIAGGVAKISKLGQGLLDLHSKRGEVDRAWLGAQAASIGATQDDVTLIRDVNTIAQAFDVMQQRGIDLGRPVATSAWETAAATLGPGIDLDIVLIDRDGRVVGESGCRTTA